VPTNCFIKGRDCNRQTRSLPGAVLTKGTGFEFGDLGSFQDDSDLCMSDKDEAFGFADVSHCGGLPEPDELGPSVHHWNADLVKLWQRMIVRLENSICDLRAGNLDQLG